MRLREALKLQAGDIVKCTGCPEHGCDGKPAKVTRDGGLFRHEGNPYYFFAKINGTVYWSEMMSARKIKLVKKASK